MFSKIGLVRRSLESRAHNLFAKNRKLYKFATTNSDFEKKLKNLDMHHEMYMYINFQQIRINRSVITVHTNVFRKKLQVV